MSEIKVTSKPTANELQVILSRKQKAMTSFRVVHKKASILLDKWVQRNFRREGKDLGADKWPPFKAGGRIKKGILDTGAKLLQDTGRLRGSFRPFHSERDAGIGSALPYSKPHELGLGHLPMRRMLPKEKDIHDAMIKLFDSHVKKATNA